ncbi:MAG: hypothetical protein ACOVSW_18705 [Candidatus Kapaibacteriota bacterium]
MQKVTTLCPMSVFQRHPTELVQSPEKRYIAALQALFPSENYLLFIMARLVFSLRWMIVFAITFAAIPVFIHTQTLPDYVWQKTAGMISDQKIICLHTIGNRLLAGTNDGVFLSTNLSDTWTQTQGWSGQEVTSFFRASGTLFATTWGGGVFRSTNDGQSWTAANQGLQPTNRQARAMAQLGSRLFLGTQRGLLSSDDDGNSWRVLTQLDVRSLQVAGSVVVAGTVEDGIIRSVDGGRTWDFANNGLPGTARTVFSFCSYTPHEMVLFAGTNAGIFRSNDSGATWRAAGLPGQQIEALYQDRIEIFAGTLGGGVFVSADYGYTWRPVNTGLTNLRVLSFTKSGENLIAGTDGSGTWRTVNGNFSDAQLAVSTDSIRLDTTIAGVAGNARSISLVAQGSSTQPLTITASSGIEVANFGDAFLPSLSIPAGLQATLIQARLFSPISGTINGTITFRQGAAERTVVVTGTVLEPPPPELAITPAAINLGSVLQGANSTAQTLTLTGKNITGQTTVFAPRGTLLFDPVNRIWVSILILAPFVQTTTISIRLHSALQPFAINSAVTAQSGIAQASAAVAGVIEEAPKFPLLLTSETAADSQISFGQFTRGGASPVRTYNLVGRNLLAPVTINSIADVQFLNPANGAWVRSLTLFPDRLGSLAQTISVRIDSSRLSGALVSRINHTSTGTSATIEIVAIVQDPARLFVQPRSLDFGTLRLGNAVQTQQYVLTGQDLLDPLFLTAPDGVEILDTVSNTWQRSIRLMLTYTPNTANIRCNFTVRFNTSQVRRLDSVIINTSGETRATVRVLGNVIPQPELTAIAQPSADFGEPLIHFDPSPVRSYTLRGRFLGSPVRVTVPQGVLLRDSAQTVWVNALTLLPNPDSTLGRRIFVKLDSSRLGAVEDSIRNISAATSASIAVRGAVVALALPPGAETTLELRFIGQQPLRVRDSARIQLWLKGSRLLTPRLIGRFLRSLRATVRIDTNNLAVLGISPLTPRARMESPSVVPANTANYTIFVERTDTTSMENLLLAELLVRATLGSTTSNTIRLTQPTQWLGTNGSVTPASDIRILSEPEALAIQLRPLFARRNGLVTVIAPNPSSDLVQIRYALSAKSAVANVVLELSDAAGRVVKRRTLGDRATGLVHEEAFDVQALAAGAYYLRVITAEEVLYGRVDIVR